MVVGPDVNNTQQKVARRTGAAAAAAAPSSAAASPRRAVVLAAKKGGGFSAEGKPAGLKVNSRGKVSSRPGPPSRKEMQQQQMMQQQMMQQQQQQQSGGGGAAQATTTASSSSAASAPAATASTSGRAAAAAPANAAAAQAAAAANATSTPQPVIDRMARRVAGFAIVPLVGGVASLGVFWYLKVVQKVEYPMWLAYLGSSLLFGGGLLGITYGILSTSWDPRREGSFWGWTEVQANIALLMERGKK